jgi:dihydroorotase
MLLVYNARIVDKNTDKKGALLVDGKRIKSLLTEAEAKNLVNGKAAAERNKLLLKKKDAQKKQLASVAKKLDKKEAELMKYYKDLLHLETFDAQGLTVMPSFIDMHAHFRDPGFTQKEDMESGCRAAVAGGYGTVVLMPNTKPVISYEAQAEANDMHAKAFNIVNVIQSASITSNFDGVSISHLNTLNQKKVPLITEDGHEVENPFVMLAAMISAAQKKLIVSCHCEDPSLAAQAKQFRNQALSLLPKKANLKKAASLLTTANKYLEVAEDISTTRNIRLAESAGCHIHLCHVSTAKCIEAVRAAKKQAAKKSPFSITCEVTPHHLGLTGTSAPNIFHIVNPPLRSEEDRRALIEALFDGTADCISTDHAPHTAEDKASGSPGFTGLETSFALCNTVLVKGKNNPYQRVIPLSKLSALMSANPAAILGLSKRGLLAPGYEADFVVVDPDKCWTVHSATFASKGKYTPLEGKKVIGKVMGTFFNGKKVF